ncbi:UDP-N-acetylmuramoyl-L-alanyl-D-glutamate--2, 6-diaminopimelate ligase [Candidatus Hepatincola sp. Pdp]
MQLQELLKYNKISTKILNEQLKNIEIKHITDNSNNIKPNTLFVAIVGYKASGINFVTQALQQGAVVVVIPEKERAQFLEYKNIITVEDPRKFFANSIFYFYKNILPKNIFTVTGTNGKTSTASFVSQILSALGITNMAIGTLGVTIGEECLADTMTTPATTDLIKYFQIAKKRNINYVVLESSSHGIEQYRTFGLHFQGVAFTNLTQDHLDYYHNLANYFQAKLKLFTEYSYDYAVVNTDDTYGKQIQQTCKNKNIFTYGKSSTDLHIKQILPKHSLQTVIITYKNKDYKFTLNLMGEFQVYNVLCALTLLLIHGISLDAMLPILPKLVSAAGRMLLFQAPSGGKIFVDYAHTPDALKSVLTVLKKEKPIRLKVLFGCGGNRDVHKRPLMGAIAANLADAIYVADDNPRFEDPAAIRQEIITGAMQENPKAIIFNIDSRKQAMEQAIRELQDHEILLIAGRGPEKFHIIKDKKIPLSDIEVVKATINELQHEIKQ